MDGLLQPSPLYKPVEHPAGIQWIQSVIRSAPVCPQPVFYQTPTTAENITSVKRILINLLDGMQSTWVVHHLSCLTPVWMFATTLKRLTVGQGPSIDVSCKNVFKNANKENSFDSKFHWYAWLENVGTKTPYQKFEGKVCLFVTEEEIDSAQISTELDNIWYLLLLDYCSMFVLWMDQ